MNLIRFSTVCSLVRQCKNPLAGILEPLEARIAPAAVFWDGGGDGINWTNAGNWSNNAVPTAADDVTINPGGAIAVSLSSGAQVIASLSMPGDDALALSGGSLTISGASVIHNFSLSGGVLFASSATSLEGNASFSGNGTLGGTAVVTIPTGSTLNVAGGEPNLATELVVQNGATITHGNAYLDFDGATAKLRVVSGAIYESMNTSSGFGFRAFNGPAGVFIETGGVLRHGPSNGATFNVGANVPLDVNGGTLQATGPNGGALILDGIGTFMNANLVPSINTAINFSGNNNTVVGTITGSGAGVVNLGTGQLHAAAGGATLNFPAGLFNVSGTATLSGPGVFTNTGRIQITGGEPNLETELVNAGAIIHGSAYLDFDGATAELRVVAGGLYESVNTSSGFGFRAFNGPAGVFVEAGGVFRHATPNGASFDLENDMPLTVLGGTIQNTGATGAALNLSGIGTFTNAGFQPIAGTSIRFNGANNKIVGSATGSSAGSVQVDNGTLLADAAGATLNFPTGLFNLLNSGTLAGPGVFTNIGAIQITAGDPNLTTELVNAGTIRHGNAYLDFDGATAKLRVVSGAIYESMNTSSGFGFRAFNGPAGVFIETGGVLRHGPSNGATFNVGANVPLDVNGGTLQATGPNGGALILDGIGTFTNANLVPSINTAINFSGNNNTVVGTITGSGAGVVNLGTGQLHAAAGGVTLNFPAGLFNVSGTATLSGPGVFTNTGRIQITGGEPNLETELVNAGAIIHGSAYLDFDGATAELRVVAGGLYESVNTSSGFGFRAFNGPAGVFVEAGLVASGGIVCVGPP